MILFPYFIIPKNRMKVKDLPALSARFRLLSGSNELFFIIKSRFARNGKTALMKNL